jgi:hypothetical protein
LTSWSFGLHTEEIPALKVTRIFTRHRSGVREEGLRGVLRHFDFVTTLFSLELPMPKEVTTHSRELITGLPGVAAFW